MSRVIKPCEICAQIEVHGVVIENATPEIINIHKNNPSLIVGVSAFVWECNSCKQRGIRGNEY